jgi:DNA-binding transcriptional LysR family regulator
MALNHREVAAFLAVARAGGVGAAAKSLSLSQPAITRSLKRLERQLGVALFVRHSTGMEVTPFGRTLIPYAETLESETERILEEISVLNGAAAGLARVGIVPASRPICCRKRSRARSRLRPVSRSASSRRQVASSCRH